MRTSPLFLFVVLAACSAPATTSGGATSAPTPEPVVAPAATPGPVAPVRITAPACGYGGSATAVAVFLDVENDVALDGVAATLVATDAVSHARVGASSPPISLYVAPPTHALTDFSTSGTTPFAGSLAAGAHTRLLFFSGLDATPTGFGPIDVTLTLTADGAQTFEVHCTTEGMWPSS